MCDQTSHVESVTAGLRICNWHAGTDKDAVQYLNASGRRTQDNELWTVEALQSFVAEHEIPRSPVLDVSGWQSPPVNLDLWEPRRILRCIERGTRIEMALLRREVQRNPKVCQDVLRLTAKYAQNPYQPEMYEFWHRYAAYHTAD